MSLGITVDRQVFNSSAIKDPFQSYITKNVTKQKKNAEDLKTQATRENRTGNDNGFVQAGPQR